MNRRWLTLFFKRHISPARRWLGGPQKRRPTATASPRHPTTYAAHRAGYTPRDEKP